jgi:quinol monooxygenase YgiN
MREPTRREFIAATGAAVLAAGCAPLQTATKTEGIKMYGVIGNMKARPGQRDAVIEILLDGVNDMPGCLSYIVARDLTDADALWITEVWDSQESHRASLSLPAVQQAIARGRPLIAGFGERFETNPVGGHGLVRPAA